MMASQDHHQQRQRPAPDADPQQQLVIQTRDLTLLTPSPSSSNSDSRAGTPPGTSPRLAQRGDDATTRHCPELGEPASRAADVLDAQPTAALAAKNHGSAFASEGMEIFDEMQAAADRGTAAGGSFRSSASTASGSPGLFASEGASPEYRTEKSMTVGTAPRNSPLWLWGRDVPRLDGMPNEVLTHILSFLDVGDLLATSRVSCLFP